MFVFRPENPRLTDALAEVNIMDVNVCKQTYLPKNKSIIVLLYNAFTLIIFFEFKYKTCCNINMANMEERNIQFKCAYMK